MLDLCFVPPRIRFTKVPVHMMPVEGLGIVGTDLKTAVYEACEQGLILPRKTEGYQLVPAAELGAVIQKKISEGWKTYLGPGKVLCLVGEKPKRALATFEQIAEICTHRKASHCSILDGKCSKHSCIVWKKFEEVEE